MTTVFLIAVTVVAVAASVLALLLCAAAARADRRLQHALLEALGWRAEWPLFEEPSAAPYKERPAS